MSNARAGSVASPFRQPKAVFAVAFACVVSFMGIGLVDPIFPAISHELNASPSEGITLRQADGETKSRSSAPIKLQEIKPTDAAFLQMQ